MSDYFTREFVFKEAEIKLIETVKENLYFAVRGDYTAGFTLSADEVERFSVGLKEFVQRKSYGPCKPETSQPTSSAAGAGNQRYTYVAPKPGTDGRCVTIDGPSYTRSEEKAADSVESPSHYRAGKVECVDALDSATVGLNGVEGFHIANVIKYVWRWKFKNGLEDLKKARWYLDRLIKKEEEERAKNE